MKKVLLFVAVVGFAASFTSCKKCVTCTHSVLGEQELCDGSKTARDAFESTYTAAGYSCD